MGRSQGTVGSIRAIQAAPAHIVPLAYRVELLPAVDLLAQSTSRAVDDITTTPAHELPC